MKLIVDLENSKLLVQLNDGSFEYDLNSKEAFYYISKAWLRCGWDNKYVYGFTWLGRPIIQLPEDMIRIQEVIYQIKPDVIIETGVAHGGTLIYYSTLCKALGKGRVIGVDIEIREHNRKKIEEHELSEYITLIEGNSVDPEVVQQVKSLIHEGDKVLVILDSNHTKQHVLEELMLYSPLVSVGSYIVATDGSMEDFAGAPRSNEDWAWNNPKAAAEQFVMDEPRFEIQEPPYLFNESGISDRVTYWPSAFIKRLKE
ncbi:cephalosporin hydroxylase family protein [Paenibacillus guangzhouensis]|uniref:cephalosporin hydroxylase family protein n=1 Tax=Paenibacillus guangzhouensis TaxID=1473112 RepID=UPI001266F276|nr:CmcI family methyltransferase [Paenibacillus guangzhouensis]